MSSGPGAHQRAQAATYRANVRSDGHADSHSDGHQPKQFRMQFPC